MPLGKWATNFLENGAPFLKGHHFSAPKTLFLYIFRKWMESGAKTVAKKVVLWTVKWYPKGTVLVPCIGFFCLSEGMLLGDKNWKC